MTLGEAQSILQHEDLSEEGEEAFWWLIQKIEKGIDKERLRDEFAMHALTGLITNPNWHVDFELTAKQAYEISDAMMKAREVSNG